MENVAGLNDERYSELVNNTLSQCREFNYTVSEWQLNAANYEVPQSRERVFWVGSRLGNIEAPTTAGIKTTIKDALADLASLETLLTLDTDIIELPPDAAIAISACAYARKLIALFPPQHATACGSVNLQGCAKTQHNDETRKRFAAVTPGDKEPISRFPRLDWHGLAPTLRAGTGSDKGRHTAPRPIHPEFPRVITVREAARLHSFPDWFQFHPTKWRGFRMVGNAVPPLLALAFGKQIFQALAQNTAPDHRLKPNSSANHSNSIYQTTHSKDEITMDATTVKLTYNFDYTYQFQSPSLEKKAQKTLSNFLGFVRHTFDRLVENGSALWDLYYDCITFLGKKEGKKAFDAWLDSDDFGASRYMAVAAMQISQWFNSLPKRIQKLIQNNVQKWSVAALKQLTKVSIGLVKELVRGKKQTAASIKKAATIEQLKVGSLIKITNGRYEGEILTVISDGETDTQKIPDEWGYLWAQFSSGLKIKLDIDNIEPYACDLSPSTLFANPTLIASTEDWKKVNELYQLEPENSDSLRNLALIYALEDNGSDITLGHIQKAVDNFELKPIYNGSSQYNNRHSPQQEIATYDQRQAEIDAAVKAALLQREKERELEYLAKFQEIRDAALAAAETEIRAAHQKAEKLADKTASLEQQLKEKDAIIAEFQTSNRENKQLHQRVQALEKALDDANTNRWKNTFNQQAAKVVNDGLERAYQPLVSKLEEMTALVQEQAVELNELRAYTANLSSADEHVEAEQPDDDIDTFIAAFGEVAFSFGIPGWSRRGYRTTNGTLYTGLSAIKVFNQYAASLNNENSEAVEEWCLS
jgi:site-specific DNA-cytosine methylase